jgi:hypothetical protein
MELSRHQALKIETNKSIVVRPPQEWGNTATEKRVIARGEISTELINACRNTTYMSDSVGLGGNGRCFVAPRERVAKSGACDRASMLPRMLP